MEYNILSVFDTATANEEGQVFSPSVSGKQPGNKSSDKSFLGAMKAAGRTSSTGKNSSRYSAARKSILSNSWYSNRSGFKGIASYKEIAADSQRVMIKTRLIRHQGNGAEKLKSHLQYLQREGVSLDEGRGMVYGAEGQEADIERFTENSYDDRHHFRFIISPEFTDGLDLKDYTRDLMQQVEKDMNSKLEWLGVNHYNTDNPHIHVIVRGKNDKGKDLLIPPHYISEGMRHRACDLATRDLGIRCEIDVQKALNRDMLSHRFTQIDKGLLLARKEGFVDLNYAPTTLAERSDHRLKTGRLKTLAALGLAEEISPQRWRLSETLEASLRDLSIRGDVIKTLHKAMNGKRADLAIVAAEKLDAPLIGRVVKRGLDDEMQDKEYIILEGLDGKHHYVRLDVYSEDSPARTGNIVKVHLGDEFGKSVDKNIERFARSNEGVYDIAKHKAWVLENVAIPKDKVESYVNNHILRLNKLEAMGIAEKTSYGTWRVGNDLSVRLKQHVIADMRAKKQLLQVDLVCAMDLTKAVTAPGVTLLDRELVSPTLRLERADGLSGEIAAALVAREAYLRRTGLVQTDKGSRDVLAVLESHELKQYGGDGKHVCLAKGEEFEGKVSLVTLNSGKYVRVTGDDQRYVLVHYNRYHKRFDGKTVHITSRDGIQDLVVKSAAIRLGRGKEKDIDR